MNSKAIGNIGEEQAVNYLKAKGYYILERNSVNAGCEIDIIAEVYTDGSGKIVKKPNKTFNMKKPIDKPLVFKSQVIRTIVFIEVKKRSGNEFGSGLAAVTPVKIGRYVMGAKNYLSRRNLMDENVRFDVIEVGGDEIYHLENAFTTNDARYTKRYRY